MMTSFREEREEGEKNWERINDQWTAKVRNWQASWTWLSETIEEFEEGTYTPEHWKAKVKLLIARNDESIPLSSGKAGRKWRDMSFVLWKVVETNDRHLPHLEVEGPFDQVKRCTFIWSRTLMERIRKRFQYRTTKAWKLESDKIEGDFKHRRFDHVWQCLKSVEGEAEESEFSGAVWAQPSFRGFLLKQSMMLFNHPDSHRYQPLWELYYDQPDILEQAAAQCFTTNALAWSPDRLRRRSFKLYGPKDDEFPDFPSAAPLRCLLVSRLHSDFESWISEEANLFPGLSWMNPQSGFLKQHITDGDRESDDSASLLKQPEWKRALRFSQVENFNGPAVYGFQATLIVQENKYLDSLSKDILIFFDDLSKKGEKTIDIDEDLDCDAEPLDPDRPTIHVLVGPPGIGKTRKIKSLLSRKWGYHFVAASLDNSANERGKRDMYGAHADGHPSRDLHWLSRLAANYPLMAFGRSLEITVFEKWTRILLYARRRVLSIYRREARSYDKRFDHPRYWFEFQNSGDRFSTLFWFLILRDAREAVKPSPPFQDELDEPIHICVDEAQCDLDSSLIFQNLGKKIVSSNFLVVFLSVLRPLVYHGIDGIVISGTSLRLTEVKAAVNEVDLENILSGPELTMHALIRTKSEPFRQKLQASYQRYWNDSDLGEYRPMPDLDWRFSLRVICNFPSRKTEKDLETLFEDLQVFYRGFNKHDLRLAPNEKLYLKLYPSVVQHGSKLCGRYLWSILYIEELDDYMHPIGEMLRKSCRCTSGIDKLIEKAADAACQKAKSHLQLRLNKLKKHGRDHLLRRISEVALDAHLFDRQSIFEDDSDLSVIGQAFAHIEKTDDGHLQGCFAESLALEAVIDWLLKDRTEIEEQRNQDKGPLDNVTEKKPLLDSLLFQFLRHSSINSASFGIMAEWYLAMQLWASLRQSKEEHAKDIMGAKPFTARKSIILEHLRNPMLIAGDFGMEEYGWKTPLDISENAFIPPGQKIAIAHDNKDKISIWDWLIEMNACIDDTKTKSMPRSSFYLPETNAGPDLVFMLVSPVSSSKGKIKRKMKRFVCSIQLKTGEVGNGNDLQDAFEKTSIYHSYMSSGKPASGSQKGTKDWRLRRRRKIQTFFNKMKGLEDWKAFEENVVFLRILVCSSRTADLPNKERFKLKVQNRTGPNEYFIFCNAADTTDLFGGLFDRMASAMRSSSESKQTGKEEQVLLDNAVESDDASFLKENRSERLVPIRENLDPVDRSVTGKQGEGSGLRRSPRLASKQNKKL